LARYAVLQIQPVGAGHVVPDFGDFPLVGIQEGFLFREVLGGGLQVPGDNPPERLEDVPNVSDAASRASERTPDAENGTDRVKGLEKEVLDLRILNSGKDLLIDALRKDRDGMINQVVEFSRKVGQLETEVRQLSAPRNDSEGGPTLVSEGRLPE
jgi:hypothetical protein